MYRWLAHSLGNVSVNRKLGLGFGLVLLLTLAITLTGWHGLDSVIDRGVLAQADAWRQRTGGRCFAGANQEHHRVAYLRDQAGLGAHFDEIIYSAALGVCKPERVFFTNAQARMGVAVAQSILFVDDKAENVDAARAAGWRAMLYRGPESLEKALAGWG